MSYVNIISGIYSIKNNINGKMYIGQSVHIYSRWSSHKSKLRKGIHGNPYLQNAWNKYGEDNFTFSIIKQCDKFELDKYEIYYINYYNSLNGKFGYNLDYGGNTHKIRSKETIEKIVKNRKYKCSDETKKRLSEVNTGKQIPYETRRKISEHHKNAIKQGTMKPKTEHLSKYVEEQKKPINCYTKNGFYKKYNSIHECCRELNLIPTNICKVLKNKHKTSHGYTFTYSNVFLTQEELNKRYKTYRNDIKWNYIAQTDKCGNIICKFNSMKDASNILNIDMSSISKVCRGKLKSTKGYYFKYII